MSHVQQMYDNSFSLPKIISPKINAISPDNPVNGTTIAFAPERWRQWCRRLFVNGMTKAFAPARPCRAVWYSTKRGVKTG